MNLLIADNSNIFITLKQQYADNLSDSSSVRLDYEKFAKDFVKYDDLQKVIVGSTPPKTDSFWGFMKDRGWEVYTYERSKNGGEKGVDTKVVARGMRFLNECKNKGVQGNLYIMSGDRDMIPLIEDAVQDGCYVTLVTWRDSISGEYLYGDISEKIEIWYLDDLDEYVVFFERIVDGKKHKETLSEYKQKLKDSKNQKDAEEVIGKPKSEQGSTGDDWKQKFPKIGAAIAVAGTVLIAIAHLLSN